MEHFIDESKKLHDSFIQSQILFTFKQIIVLFTISAYDYKLFRPLFRDNNLNLILERINSHIINNGIVIAKQANCWFLYFR